jgi:hemin uptake protein HemP
MPTRNVKGIASTRPEPPREITSEALFQGRTELVIRHNDQRYLLRITANRKLILTR